MRAGTSGEYPILELRNLPGNLTIDPVVHITDPISIWTPAGERESPRHVMVEKNYLNSELAEAVVEFAGRRLGEEILTSGEWHQTRRTLQHRNPVVERSTITGGTEGTSTLAVIPYGQICDRSSGPLHADGFVVEHPKFYRGRSGIDLETDNNGIPLARYRWRGVPLPLMGGPIKEMPEIFGTMLDILYGVKDARRELPEGTRLYWPDLRAEAEARRQRCSSDVRILQIQCGGQYLNDRDFPEQRRANMDAWPYGIPMPAYRVALVNPAIIRRLEA